MRPFLFLPLSLWLIATSMIVLRALQALPEHDQQTREDVDELIRQLGDADFRKRETATAKLLQRRDATPALKIAARSTDAEVATRARKILDSMDAKWELLELKTLTQLGKVDQAVEKLVITRKWSDEIAAWQIMADLAAKLCELEEKAYGKTCFPKNGQFPVGDIRRFLADPEGNPLKMLTKARDARDCGGLYLALRAPAYRERVGVGMCFLAIRGDVDSAHMIRSVIFAGDSIKTYGVHQALVVCDGDLVVDGIIDDCLVIARGDVRVGKPAKIIGRSHVISCGKVHIAEGAEISSLSKVKENEPTPLGFVRFFDPALLGIKVGKAEAGVTVNDAPKDKPFGAAGMRTGDIILALDDEEPKDPESFRRLLRPKVVENEKMLFRVRRGKETLEIKVQVKD